MINLTFKKYLANLVMVSAILITALPSYAAKTDPLSHSINNPFVVNTSTLDVADDKLGGADHNDHSIKGVVSLRVLDNAFIGYSFNYTVRVRVSVYNNSNVLVGTHERDLNVDYKHGEGLTYKGLDITQFDGAHRMVVLVIGQQSNNGTLAPPANAVQLTARIEVSRRYDGFSKTTLIKPTCTANSNTRAITLTWVPPAGAEEYDIEWTSVATGGKYYNWLTTLQNNGSGNLSPSQIREGLNNIFRAGAGRVTKEDNAHTLSLIYTDKYYLVRIRAVRYLANGLRETGDWSYEQSPVGYSVFDLDAINVGWAQPTKNWQYSISYAEDGKNKEVISYFDGTLRNRQTVTFNNSDNVPVVQETIYDEFGRPAASVLPAPISSGTLSFVPQLNRNNASNTYTYKDLFARIGSNCEWEPDPIKTSNGASLYYSAANSMTSSGTNGYKSYNKFIPNANGYPFALTQYTADNTGRIKLQGGVGETFQPGKGLASPTLQPSRTTKYYYGKPEQLELDRLFGSDVGTADHYTKNMVIDPNGQISISYLNASGKTIATALAGANPEMTEKLEDTQGAGVSKKEKVQVLTPEQFTFDASALKLTATTTYLASVIDADARLDWSVQKIIERYPNTSTFSPCSNCYYKMTMTITNDCGDTVKAIVNPIQIGSAMADCNGLGDQTSFETLGINTPGAYQIKIELAFDQQVIDRYTDTLVSQGKAKGYIEKQFDFIKQQFLNSIDASGCYSDCHTCSTALGDRAKFILTVKEKLVSFGLEISASVNNDPVISTWAGALYDDLKIKCQALEANCTYDPCNAMRQTMLQDVSPGGQYALFNEAGEPLEPQINLITKTVNGQPNYKNVFGGTYTPAELAASYITRDNGSVASPFLEPFTVKELIKYWKPAWAERFLPQHPEYCGLAFCNTMSNYYSWDRMLELDVTRVAYLSKINPAAPAWNTILSNTTANENWLFDNDPFFKVGGEGYNYRTQMLSDLQNYSNNVLNIQSGYNAKGLLRYVDFKLYCQIENDDPAIAYSGWNNCVPSCRIDDREWQTYRDLYLSLKEKYYELKRQGTCNIGCPIGQPKTYSAMAPACPSSADFSIVAIGANPNVAGQQIVQVSYVGGAVKNNVYVGIYYPTAIDDPEYTHTVWFEQGSGVLTFSLPDHVDVSKLLVGTITCSDEPVFDDGISNAGVLNINQIPVPNEYPGYYLKLTVQNSIPDHEVSVQTFFNVTYMHRQGGIWSAVNGGDQYEYLTIPINSTVGYSTKYYLSTDGSLSEDYEIRNYTCYGEYGFVSGVTGFLQHCQTTPVDPGPTCPPGLAFKKSRLPISNSAYLPPVNSLAEAEALQAQATAERAVLYDQLAEGVVEGWMSALEPGLVNNNKTALRQNLRNALKVSALAGFNDTHPSGASYNIPGKPSFGSVITTTLSLTGYSPDLNPWLLTAPGDYNVKPQRVYKQLFKTNADICNKIAPLKAAAQSQGKSLYTYLTELYPQAMTLTPMEVTDLENSCNSCNYLLRYDILLPAFLDPESSVVTKTQFASAKAELSGAFNNTLSESNEVYPLIMTNFMNQKFGFTLSYEAYQTFDTSNDPNLRLVNDPGFKPVYQDPFDCLSNTLEIAVSNGRAAYDEYIRQERAKFCNSYIATCKMAQAAAYLTTTQNTYHYTLYYYDQADNLVRTVPPAGVRLLDDVSLTQLTQNRKGQGGAAGCTFDSTIPKNNTAEAMGKLRTALTSTSALAIETWTYATGTQANNIVALTDDKAWIYRMALDGTVFGIDIYPITSVASPASTGMVPTSLHYRAVMPANLFSQWVHVVVQSNGSITNGNNVPAIYVNGTQLAVTSGDASGLPGSMSITPAMADDLQVLKHMHFYNRLLGQAEILANAQSTCFMPQDVVASWYRFNIPAAGGPTTTGPGSTNETRLQDIYPDHALKTTYAYNSTNQVLRQNSPDGGKNLFWYDNLSRLTASQNDKQGAGKYSYTKYDDLGRIAEVGQKSGLSTQLTQVSAGYGNVPGVVNNPANFIGDGTNEQITQTYYDKAETGSGLAVLPAQDFLRKRVWASTYKATQAGPVLNATYYDYDISGNVKTLWQQIDGLTNYADLNTLKRLDYEYDLVSGKVNVVRYQHGKPDHFYYDYKYDAENRLTEAASGTAAIVDPYTNKTTLLKDSRRVDATYQYYLHGPLARVELGDNEHKVQGIDYAYTLQGWLKSVNGQTLNNDMGGDGTNGVAKDAFAFSLGYHNGDYTAINSHSSYFPATFTVGTNPTGKNLYNGNISHSTMAIRKLAGDAAGFTYAYDQLNRLVTANRTNITGINNWSSPDVTTASYRERFTYDANGNILSTVRNGDNGLMDNLTYNYSYSNGKLLNNKLNYVTDGVPTNTYSTDLDNQSVNNYGYDAIGNLIKDDQAGITNIDWTVYGKIANINKASGNLSYSYNSAGQRVSKNLNGLTTWYVRDAQGNTLAVYDNAGSTVNWKEQHLYGSSRLGTWNPNISNINSATTATDNEWQNSGKKQYELSNHLGNVMATITDRRVQTGTPTNWQLHADVSSAQEYYAFGSQMPGRGGNSVYNATAQTATWQTTPGAYRYGFNGKENDNDVKGTGNQQDYGMRIYDPRVGRFLSVDPITAEYPELTPYQFASNMPIASIDLDGLEASKATNWEALTYPKLKKLATVNDVWRQTQLKFPNSTPQNQHLQFKYRVGRIFESAVLDALNREKNTTRYYPDPLDRSHYLIPDAVAESATKQSVQVMGGFNSRYFWWKEGTFIDAKTSEGNSIQLTDQLGGFIDILARNNSASYSDHSILAFFGWGKPTEKNAAKSKAAFLHLITPVNTKIDQSILDYAKRKGVRVIQQEVETDGKNLRLLPAKILNENFSIRFMESIYRQGHDNDVRINFDVK